MKTFNPGDVILFEFDDAVTKCIVISYDSDTGDYNMITATGHRHRFTDRDSHRVTDLNLSAFDQI